jgi:undecaprenyl diphosphate synthase
MALLMDSLEEETFMKNNISFRVIGDMGKLPIEVQERLRQTIEHTRKNTGMCMVLAISYSSKWELTESVKDIAKAVKEEKLNISDITEETIASYLRTNFMPDPDLLIRTGGELRLSNYLLWQCAYTELYFCDTYWPDFDEEEFCKAIYDYQQRERRYGKTSEQI